MNQDDFETIRLSAVALSAPLHPPLWDSFAITRALVFAGDRSQVVTIARTLRQLWVLLLVGLLSSVFTACGSTFVYKDNGIIPRAFFGMTVLDSENVNPPLELWNYQDMGLLSYA